MPTLLTLPFEVRIKILEYAIDENEINAGQRTWSDCNTDFQLPVLNLSLSCKKIYREVLAFHPARITLKVSGYDHLGMLLLQNKALLDKWVKRVKFD